MSGDSRLKSSGVCASHRVDLRPALDEDKGGHRGDVVLASDRLVCIDITL
jgi:hypothetical protein